MAIPSVIVSIPTYDPPDRNRCRVGEPGPASRYGLAYCYCPVCQGKALFGLWLYRILGG